jgi:integrase
MARKDGIYKRGKTYWITFTDVTGKRRWESSKSKYYAAAEKLLAIRRTETAHGKLPEILSKQQRTTFAELAEKYITHCAPQRNARGKENIIRNFLIPFFGENKQASVLKLIDFESFYARQLENVAPSTANRRMATLKNMITKAVDWGLAYDEILKAVRKVKLLPENERARLRYLTLDEARELLISCQDDLQAMVALALYAGMRRGEIFDLKWEDVSFEINFIHVRRSKVAEQRHVPVSDELLRILKNHHTRSTGNGHVFQSRSGGRREDIRHAFDSACKIAGIKDFHFHDLRHTFASWLVMAGVDLTTVSRLMGHKSLAMTLRYSHLAPGHLHKAVNTMPSFNDTSAKMAKYSFQIVWSKEDNVYVANSPEFPELSANGKSPGEALKGIELAVAAAASTIKIHYCPVNS